MKRKNEENRIVVIFARTMDTHACNELEDELTGLVNECELNGLSIMLDLGEVEFIASSFLRLCAKASRQLGTEKVSVINVSPPIKKVFKIAGFADHLSIS